ncbi:hypothetical protein [Aliikangiella sp. IMCC44359]|uniref:hypothetical protein n=1 Tax=Aliikangiella sp. IMCC44359 TaxID=3459125 RepID=UPI00403B115E
MEYNTNSDRLHKEQIINKGELSTEQVKAIDGLSTEETEQLISIHKKLSGGGAPDKSTIVGVPL